MSIDEGGAWARTGSGAQPTGQPPLFPSHPLPTGIAGPQAYGFRGAHRVQLPAIPAPMCMIEFAAGEFSQEAFHIHHIPFSADMARSVQKRQAEHFFGRMAARLALQAHGLSHVAVPTGRSRQPLWPEGMVGSITHNTRHAAAVALPAQALSGIGIDIETIVAAEMLDGIVAMTLSQQEVADLRRHASTLPFASLVSIAFSAKESLFKAVFHEVGYHFDFSAAHLQDFDLRDQTLRLVVQQDLSHHIKKGDAFLAHFGWIASDEICTCCAYRR